jgi:excisionase family DNA binding protein
MAALSLREAAEQTGTSKSTIFRAIRAGRLSADRDQDGNFAIDPAELFRVYPPKSEEVALTRSESRVEGQDASAFDTVELRVRNAELEGQIKALRLLLETAQKREEDLKSERDRWAAQAERLVLTAPQPVAQQQPQQRGWWPFRRSA